MTRVRRDVAHRMKLRRKHPRGCAKRRPACRASMLSSPCCLSLFISGFFLEAIPWKPLAHANRDSTIARAIVTLRYGKSMIAHVPKEESRFFKTEGEISLRRNFQISSETRLRSNAINYLKRGCRGKRYVYISAIMANRLTRRCAITLRPRHLRGSSLIHSGDSSTRRLAVSGERERERDRYRALMARKVPSK